MATAVLEAIETRAKNMPLHQPIWYNGSRFTLLANGEQTGGRFSMVHVVAKPGCEPPKHIHHNEEEMFYILEGSVTVFRGDETIHLSANECAFLPRNVPHTFRIDSPEARALIMVTPSGFENYFWSLGEVATSTNLPAGYQKPSIPEMIEAASKFGIQFV